MTRDKFYEVVCELRDEKRVSPCRIARDIGSDFRTVKSILDKGKKLNIIKCEEKTIAGRTYSECSLTLAYEEIITNKKHENGK